MSAFARFRGSPDCVSSLKVDMDQSEVCLVYSVRWSGWSGWSSKYIVIHQSSSQISATATLFFGSMGRTKVKKVEAAQKKQHFLYPGGPIQVFTHPPLNKARGQLRGAGEKHGPSGKMRRPSGFSTGGTLGQWRRRGRSKNTGGSRHCFSS